MTRRSTAHVSVDFDRRGKQTGYVSIPHSPHEDAWGATRLPISVISGGPGPTAILMAGNHGDEYEGMITLGELIRELDPGEVQGRLILLPALNGPASYIGRRTSPVDGLNLNRTFPGDPLGSITQQITAFITDHIYPLGDALIDLHSGGSSLDILPSAAIEPAPSDEHLRRNVAATLAFGAPLTVVIDNLGEPRTSTATAVRAGLTVVGTEMAGKGTVTNEALEICRKGVRGVLAHLGILQSQPNLAPPGKVLKIPGPSAFVYSESVGVFESRHALGAEVRAGDIAGWVHDVMRPWRAPEVLRYGHDGILYARRHPGQVVHGSCCAVVAAPWEGQLM